MEENKIEEYVHDLFFSLKLDERREEDLFLKRFYPKEIQKENNSLLKN